LPQDIEAERAVLGSMLHGKDAIAEVIAVLGDAGSETLVRQKHQHLYDALVKLYVEDRPTNDGHVIRDELVRRGLWEQLGKFDFLASLLSAVPSALRAHHYAEMVYEKYLLRQLIGAMHRVTQVALDDDQPTKEVLDFAESEIFKVTERRVSGQAQTINDLVREAFRTIEARGQDGTLTGEPTGFAELDDITSGLQPGELIIVAGRPSMGKTALGLNMAEHLAITGHRPALFFSLEMSRQQIAQRVLCSRARVDAHRLRRGRHSNQDLERLKTAADDLRAAPLLVDDTADLTVLELRARARLAFRRYQIRAIFVDYLQLMRLPRAESRQVEVATISRGLKALAKDLNVPVVAMAQLNRSPEDKTRRGNRPRMSDLRESGAIEQDADVIMLLHRESYYQTNPIATPGEEEPARGEREAADENVAELIIAKQRNGPTGEIKLHFNRQFTRFDNHVPDAGRYEYAPRETRETPF
jgi:replicative DNA helicase